MWLGTLFTSTAAAFGRLFIVGILPNAVLTAFVWILLSSGAFDHDRAPLRFADLIRPTFRTDAGGLLLFVLFVMLITALIQPLQIRIVRLVEGYWQSGRIMSFAFRAGVHHHARRYEKLRRHVTEASRATTDKSLSTKSVADQIRDQRTFRRADAKAKRAAERLLRYPPVGTALLPTALGNVLRRYEKIAGGRYKLSTVHTWSHLYPHLSDRLAAEFDAETDSLDASVNLTVILALMSALGLVAFADDTWLLVIPALLVILATTAYRAALAAAEDHGRLVAIAYDLHRFDMIKALHLDLPDTPEAEARRNRYLSIYLENLSLDTDPMPAAKLLSAMTYQHEDRS